VGGVEAAVATTVDAGSDGSPGGSSDGGEKGPVWREELVAQLESAGAVGDALAMGGDAEALAATWPV